MIQRNITIINKLGLHARAASKLVNVAQGFESQITLSQGDKRANAKSIMSLLVLAAPKNSELLLEVTGDDETEAEEAIAFLINNRFDETE
jgi:phosphocarrier protein HPr